MNAVLGNPGVLSLAAGFTDNAVLPAELVKEVVGDLTARPGEPEYLQYGMNSGRPGLREEVLKLLSGYPGENALSLSIEDVLITNGSQQALYIATQVLCDPGDIILVEQPTYFVYLEVLKGLGVKPVSIPTTPDGRIDFDVLRALLKRFEESGEYKKVKAVYVGTYYANPSSRSMPEEDKRALAELLHSLDYALPVIEDSAYRELYFEHPYPAPSVLSLPEFADLPCLYTGTFTKPFATGMKVGFACCNDESWLHKLRNVKGQQDFGTANLTQAIIEEVLQSGRYTGFLDSVRVHYRGKMEVLHHALEENGLRDLGWSWSKPEGGLLMWMRAPESLSTGVDGEFCQACLGNGVIYVPGELCFADGVPTNFIRLSYGTFEDDKLREAARRFVVCARQMS